VLLIIGRAFKPFFVTKKKKKKKKKRKKKRKANTYDFTKEKLYMQTLKIRM